MGGLVSEDDWGAEVDIGTVRAIAVKTWAEEGKAYEREVGLGQHFQRFDEVGGQTEKIDNPIWKIKKHAN